MYSLRNQYPIEQLPNRIRLSSGLTRTGGDYSEEEINDAGYKYVEDKPTVESTKHVLWNEDSGNWNIVDKTEEDIAQEKAIAWMSIREKRNKLLADSDWTQCADVPGQYALQEKRKLKLEWMEYRKILRDITTIYSNPSDVIWPDQPGQ